MTLEALSNATGIPLPTLSHYETGRRSVTPENALKLSIPLKENAGLIQSFSDNTRDLYNQVRGVNMERTRQEGLVREPGFSKGNGICQYVSRAAIEAACKAAVEAGDWAAVAEAAILIQNLSPDKPPFAYPTAGGTKTTKETLQ